MYLLIDFCIYLYTFVVRFKRNCLIDLKLHWIFYFIKFNL